MAATSSVPGPTSSATVVPSFLARPSATPASVSNYPYLVTKVRFPLALLPAVVVGAAGVQMVLSLAIAVFFSAFKGLSLQALWLPAALLPLVGYGLALGWLLGSAAVTIVLRWLAVALDWRLPAWRMD